MIIEIWNEAFAGAFEIQCFASQKDLRKRTRGTMSPASRNNFKTGRSYSFENVNIKRHKRCELASLLKGRGAIVRRYIMDWTLFKRFPLERRPTSLFVSCERFSLDYCVKSRTSHLSSVLCASISEIFIIQMYREVCTEHPSVGAKDAIF